MREQAIHSIRYKHTFEVLLDFLNQYEGKSREIRLIEFQSYLSDQIGSHDEMRGSSKREQDRTLSVRMV